MYPPHRSASLARSTASTQSSQGASSSTKTNPATAAAPQTGSPRSQHSAYPQYTGFSDDGRSSSSEYGSSFMPGDPGGFVLPMSLPFNSGASMSMPPPPPPPPQFGGYPYQQQYSWGGNGQLNSSYPSTYPPPPMADIHPPGGFVIPGGHYPPQMTSPYSSQMAPPSPYSPAMSVNGGGSVYSGSSAMVTSAPVLSDAQADYSKQQQQQQPPPYSPQSTYATPATPVTPVATSASSAYANGGTNLPSRQQSVSSQYSRYSYQPLQQSSGASVHSYNPFTPNSSTTTFEQPPQQQQQQQQQVQKHGYNWEDIRWSPANQGTIPGSVLVSGKNNGEDVYVGRGISRGHTLVGMTTQKLSGVVAEQNGVPVLARQYEVLCMPAEMARWVHITAPLDVSALGLAVPVVAAKDGPGENSVYVARIRRDGNTFVAGAFDGDQSGVSYICYGKKQTAEEFELLYVAP
ncbi:hypothetical protein GQ54DRAFT_311664 [Martensiomyces pterosporus]|nr:hypothetical protein GQ54DRAFT_311664 [Martensiomyces pterosporus]